MNGSDTEFQARMVRALEAASSRIEALERQQFESIAIVGMACRFPGGVQDPESFWQLLREGRDAVGPLPDDRCDLADCFDPDPTVPGRTYVRDGGFLQHVDHFDAEFFGISPREAEGLDPQQRLLLETAFHAIENAGLPRERLRGSRTGVFVGLTTSDYGRGLANNREQIDAYYVTGTTLNMAAGRLSYWFGLRGPSLSIDTACSSSLVAIHVACQSLRSRECDAALAGGVNVILATEGFIALSKAGVLARDGRCRTFDAAADGMTRGEGCGVLVLKRLSDAVAAGDRVAAVIRGSAVNQDGASAGITVPNGPAQQDVIQSALANARLKADDIDYVEAHGTGTALGDPIEVGALAEVFAGARSRPLIVGSVKSNIGHLESAAGVASVVKAVLCLRHGEIPPQVHFTTPSPHIPWDRLPIRVPVLPTPWPRSKGPRRAGVSSFGLSGTNAHIVLEEASEAALAETRADHSDETDGSRLLAFSAATAGALRETSRAYAQLLEQSTAPLGLICSAAALHRDHHAHRAAVVASSLAEASALARSIERGEQPPCVRRGQSGHAPFANVAVLFTGQGAQHAGMGRRLYEREPVFRRTVDACSTAAGHNLLAMSGDVNDTQHAQPALLALELALAELLKSWGIEPAAVLGHSVGEFAAAYVAGVFDLADAVRLVCERGRLMGMLPRDGAMLSVTGAAAADVTDLVRAEEETLAVAAVNAPDQVVLSGRFDAVERAGRKLAASGAFCRPLVVSHAYHSPLMSSVAAPFREALSRVKLRRPTLPLVSNVTGEIAGDEVTEPEYWIRHLLQPVQFARGVAALRSRGFRVFVEAGPHPTLTTLGRACVPDEDVQWISTLERDRDDVEAMLLSAASLYVHGAALDWAAIHRGRPAPHVQLPAYPFQRKRYWCLRRDTAPVPVRHPQPLFELAWTPLPAEMARPSAGRWLLAGGGHDAVETLRRYLVVRGADVRGVGPLPASDDLRRAVVSDAVTDRLDVVYVAATDGRSTTGEPMCADVLALVQTLAEARSLREGRRLWLVTRGAQAIGSHEVAVSQASLWGLGRVIALEHPDLWGGLIDVDPEAAFDPASVVAEIASDSACTEIAYRGGRRLVPSLRVWPGRESTAARFDPDASYLITGGAGGLGLSAAEWIVDGGARHLILAGRSHPREAAAARIDRLRRRGANVLFVPADVGHRGDVDRLVASANGIAPLRGVIHAAGWNADGMLRTQDASALAATMHGKAAGAVHLDAATRGATLDFFVLFSSLASVLGSIGQGPYAAANSVLDAIAAERSRLGLPAVAINWGPWAEVGMAARLAETARETLVRRGFSFFTPDEGLHILGSLLGFRGAHVVAARFDAAVLRRHLGTHGRTPLDDLLTASGTDAFATTVERVGLDPAVAVRDRGQLIEYLTAVLRGILRLDGQCQPTSTASLQQQGVDSMMATEFRNRLMRELGIDVPIASFLSNASLDTLADVVTRELAMQSLVRNHAARGDAVEEIVL